MLPSLEPLEPRQMLSNSPAQWRIDGDHHGLATDDQIVIRVSPDRPSRIEAMVNGVVVGSRSRKNLRQVLIKSGRGNDRVDVKLGRPDQHLLFRIYGGRGDDTLSGGGGRDILRGQAGADHLNGGKDHVRDILYRDAMDIVVASLPDLVRSDKHVQPPAPIAIDPPPHGILPREPNDAPTLEEGINRFALDLYSILAQQQQNAGKNLFFSPYSIATALGMLAARNPEMAENVAGLLHRAGSELSSSFAQMLDRWKANPAAPPPYELSIANAAWFSDRFPLPAEYSATLRSDFDAKIERLNFAENLAAAKIINDWISEITHGRIPQLMSPDALGPYTTYVLTNAMYFKGEWEHGFDSRFTLSSPFSLPGGTTKNVAMMYQTDSFNYFANDQLQLLELPYKGDDLSMVVLLPRDENGLQRLGPSLSADNLNLWLDESYKQNVHVHLPRFKMDKKFALLDPLVELGLNIQVSGSESVSQIVHQANIDVNEEGTVAAAATGIVVTATCVCPPPVVPTFNADYPFLYAIRDRRTGGLMFLGQQTEPPAAPPDMAAANELVFQYPR